MVGSVVEGARLRRGDVVLLERDRELGLVEQAMSDTLDGRGSVVLIEGPAGIGKTTILRAASEHARERDARVLTACGFALEGDFPFGVVRQLFEPVRAAVPEDAWCQLLEGAAGLAGRVFDGADVAPVEADAPHATLHGLFWLAANVAGERPLVVAVDDVQWADPPSLRWLSHLANRLQELPILLLLARRTGPDDRAAALLDELRATAGLTLRPGTLTLEATSALVRDRLGEDTGSDLAPACQATTGGNPFLLNALLGALVAEGTIRGNDALARVAQLGPEPIARSVMRSVASLPGGAESLARALAVLGGPAPVRHAAALAGQEPATTARLADALRAANILAPGTKLEFAHPIVRAAIYEAIPPGERALAHAQAATLLAREDADTERVAVHLLRSEPAGRGEVVGLLRAAATSASGRGAPDAAAVYLRRALDEPPDPGDKPALLTELGLSLAAARQAAAPEILREAVELSADPVQRADRALLSARMLGIWGYHDTAIEVCREALAEAEAIDPAQVDQVEVELAGNAVVSPAAAAEGLTLIAAHADDPAASSSWRIMAAFADTVIGRPADDALSRVGPVLAGQLGPPAPDSLIPVYLVLALVWNDALIPARAACDAVIDAAQLRGSMSAVAHASCVRSIIAHRCGQLDDAINDGRLALEFKLKTSPPAAVVWAAAFCIEALTEQGNLEEADAIAEEACAREPPEDWVHTVTFLQARGALRAAQGRFEEALDDLQTAGTGMRGLGIEHPGAAIWRAHAALAHLAIGQPDQAARLAAEQLDLARRVGTDRLLGIALRISAATAGDERAESSLTEAVSLLERTPARLELAHALADLGALRRRAGRRSEARDPLLKARELADRAGAAALAARAHAELLAAGARPRRAALSGPDALTAAERRVAALATQGLTNRQIAQRLFITQPTVETHLRHTFQKLDITSRNEISPRLRGA